MNAQPTRPSAPGVSAVSESYWEIGDITFLTESHHLVIGPRRVRLRPQASTLLSLLAEHHGRVVKTEDAISVLWGTHASGSAHQVHGVILELRKALGKERQAYLETVPHVGYRLSDATRYVPGREAETPPRPASLGRPADIYLHPNGRFEKQGDVWTEYGNDLTEPKYTFFEHWRDDKYIYLVDKSRRRDPGRPFLLRLPIRGGYASWGYPNPLVWVENLTIVKPERARKVTRNSSTSRERS